MRIGDDNLKNNISSTYFHRDIDSNKFFSMGYIVKKYAYNKW